MFTLPSLKHPRTLIASLVISSALLISCNDIVGPRVSPAGLPRMSNGSVPEKIARRLCSWYDGETVCGLVVPNGDGIVYLPPMNNASWSPDALQLAGEIGERIYVMSAATGVATRLTLGDHTDLHPDWSPDGARIAFTSTRDGMAGIFTMNAASGGDVVRVTSGVRVAPYGGNPSWSPDARSIVFDCEIDTGNVDLCIANVESGEITRLTSTTTSDRDADWSPDGTKMVFMQGYQVSVMNADGSNVVALYGGLAHPAWSPGGGRIAFTMPNLEGICSTYCEDAVYVMNADGSNAVRFADGSQPAWRPAAGDTPPPYDAPPVAQFIFTCENMKCDVYSTSYDDHEITTSSFNFGDGGEPQSGGSAWHLYAAEGTYVVTLTVKDGLGQTASVSHSITVPQPPQPPYLQYGYCTHLTCTFGLNVVDSYIVSQLFDFGDGTTSTERNPIHTYAAAGTYQIAVTVTNAAGQTSAPRLYTQTVSAPPPPVDQRPTAHFTYSCSGTTCTFDGRSSTDDVGIVSYNWTLGNAGAASGPVVSAKFKGRGWQSITLTVSDTAGQTTTVTLMVTLR